MNKRGQEAGMAEAPTVYERALRRGAERERKAIVNMLLALIEEIVHTSHADGLGMGDQRSESVVRECIERIQRRAQGGTDADG